MHRYNAKDGRQSGEKQRKASVCDDIETLCEELANEKVKLVAMSQAGDNGDKNIKKKKK